MKLINRDEALEVIEKLIKSRTCDCSRQKAIEKQAFEYCRLIISKLKTYETDQDVR